MTVEQQYDLVIIGAGPAGMAGAHEAAVAGLKTLIVDEQSGAGGQIYRNIGQPILQNRSILGQDYYVGESLLAGLAHTLITHIANATVWEVANHTLYFSVAGETRQVRFNKLLLATGAQERPVPFSGWTLPGVMTCGAAQILLKSSGLTPAGPLVIAGSGPLLLLIACQLIRAGVSLAAIVDTTPISNYKRALKEIKGAVKGWRYLLKGMRMLKEIRASGVKYYKYAKELSAEADSDGNLKSISFGKGKTRHQVDCRTLLVHQGVIPNTQLGRALGLTHQWDDIQQCWKPALSENGSSNRPDIFVAGDSGGIGGAIVAEIQGRIVANEIAKQLNHTKNVVSRITQLRVELADQLAIRPFLDHLYRPLDMFLRPQGETIVCRCEEISAAEIRGLAKKGCIGPNQTKAFCRSGMGPCQGRQCGSAVAALLADELDKTPAQVGYYTIRFPIKPVTLGELASLNQTDSN
ncbi:NAD(P)/FAD-dependent oxidoreductase [Amphritea sp.]|uniref:FAD/NAD(P)-dependent oxidoreductase n=1 Tax=Amphritea sp. TaxID=1872502 RepID=UPI003A916579